jgi:hypothetical protein
MKLRGKVKVNSRYKGRSKFEFWKGLVEGDEIEMSVTIVDVGRSRMSGRLYSTVIYFSKVGNVDEKFSCSITEAVKYLEKVDYIELN